MAVVATLCALRACKYGQELDLNYTHKGAAIKQVTRGFINKTEKSPLFKIPMII